MFALLSSLLSFPLAVTAQGASQSGSAATPADVTAALHKVTLRVGQNNGELAPLFLASHAFDGTPYKIQFSSFNNALDNYTALAAGNIDVSDSAVTTALQLQQSSAVPWTKETAPIKTVLLRVSDYPGSLARYVVIAGSKSGIKTLDAATLKGKKFAYSPGANNFLVYLATLKYYGLTPQDIKPVQLDTTSNALALLSNNVDLVSGSIELYGAAIDDGAHIVSSSGKLGIPIQSGVLANTVSLNDPIRGAAVKDFVVRYIHFQDWFNSHREEAIAAYVNGRHFTHSQAVIAWKSGRVLCEPVDAKAVADAQRVSDVLYNAGAFKKKLDVSVDFDDSLSPLVTKTLAETHYQEHLDASIKESTRGSTTVASATTSAVADQTSGK